MQANRIAGDALQQNCHPSIHTTCVSDQLSMTDATAGHEGSAQQNVVQMQGVIVFSVTSWGLSESPKPLRSGATTR